MRVAEELIEVKRSARGPDELSECLVLLSESKAKSEEENEQLLDDFGVNTGEVWLMNIQPKPYLRVVRTASMRTARTPRAVSSSSGSSRGASL